MASVGTSALPFLCLLASVPESLSRHSLRHASSLLLFSSLISQCFGAGRRVSARDFGAPLPLASLVSLGVGRGTIGAARLLSLAFLHILASVPKVWLRHKGSALLQWRRCGSFLHFVLGCFLCSTSSPFQVLFLHHFSTQKPTNSTTLCVDSVSENIMIILPKW